MPEEIVNIAHSYMTLPLRIEVAPSGATVKAVTHELFFVEKPDKPSLLDNVLKQYNGSVLIFSRTKHGARKITRLLNSKGYSAAEIHSDRSLSQRINALEGFKIGRFRILVATDIAARGIDVTGIQLVVNYDLPSTAEDYVHRIGRTARAGMAGHAISFATPEQRFEVRGIERLIRKPLPVSSTPGFARSRPSSGRSSFLPSRERPRDRNNFRRKSSFKRPLPRPPLSRRRHEPGPKGYFITRYRDTADDY